MASSAAIIAPLEALKELAESRPASLSSLGESFHSAASEEVEDAVIKNEEISQIEVVEQEQATTTHDTPSQDPSTLAHELYRDDKLLEAARVIKSQIPSENLTDEQKTILVLAEQCEQLVQTLEGNDVQDWIKIGGDKPAAKPGALVGDTTIHYRPTGDQLQICTETPIDKTLLVPLLSVLNESQLYHTWLPSWNIPPKFGIRRVNKLKQVGRCSQIIIGEFKYLIFIPHLVTRLLQYHSNRNTFCFVVVLLF